MMVNSSFGKGILQMVAELARSLQRKLARASTRMVEEAIQSTVLVTHPEADERLAYMKDLVMCLGI
jgi:hypothetical protein